MKKFLIIAVIIVMSLTTVLFATAFAPAHYNNIAEDNVSSISTGHRYVTEEIAVSTVRKMAKSYYTEAITIEKVEKIYNVDETLYAYRVEFSYGEYLDYAIVLDTWDINLLVHEFTIKTPRADKSYRSAAINADSRLYVVQPFAYAYNQGNDEYIMESGYNFPRESIGASNYSSKATLRSPIIDKDIFLNNYEGNLEKSHHLPYSSSITCLRQNSLSGGSIGNCGPAASMNILNYWQNAGYNVYGSKTAHEVYRTIVKDIMNKEIEYNIWEIENAIKKYVKTTANYKADTFVYWGAFWGYYKSDLEKDKPIIHCISSNDEGHAMAAYGYAQTSNGNYLRVASGWDTQPKYINFDAFGTKFGSYCTIKRK